MLPSEADPAVFLSGVWCHGHRPRTRSAAAILPERRCTRSQAATERRPVGDTPEADYANPDSRGGFAGSHRRRMALHLHQEWRIERWTMIKKIRAPRSTGRNTFNGPRPRDPDIQAFDISNDRSPPRRWRCADLVPARSTGDLAQQQATRRFLASIDRVRGAAIQAL